MSDTAQIEMPRYQCHKKVWALKIKEVKVTPSQSGNGPQSLSLVFDDANYAEKPISLKWYGKHEPEAGGYFVVYEDGYESYSPADAFEKGYRYIPKDENDFRRH